MLNWLKNMTEESKNVFKVMLVLAAVSVAFLYITFAFAISLSSFSVGLLKSVIAVSVLWIVDKLAFRKIDTLTLIGSNAIAYAIFFLALAVIFATCISTS
ncbi:MAG: hypothetical protein ACM34K_05720 [Bacillota bacterium]